GFAVLRIDTKRNGRLIGTELFQQRRRQRHFAPTRRWRAVLSQKRPYFEEGCDGTDQIAVPQMDRVGFSRLNRPITVDVKCPPRINDGIAVRARIECFDPAICVLRHIAATEPRDCNRRIDEYPLDFLRHAHSRCSGVKTWPRAVLASERRSTAQRVS